MQEPSRERAEAITAAVGLTEEQDTALAQAKNRLQSARIAVNLNLHERIFGTSTLDRLLVSKRVFNRFEIEHALREVNPVPARIRLLAEFKLYGGTTGVQFILGGMSNTEHPNYGVVDYLGDPIKSPVLGFYGWYRFYLKREARERSTFTAVDSAVVDSDHVFIWDDIDGVLAQRAGGTDRYWFEWINIPAIPMDEYGGVPYIEAQILGGVFLDRDVEILYYPETDELNRPFFRKLRRLAEECQFDLTSY